MNAGGQTRRSFATVVVLWVIGLAAVLVMGVQSAGLGQAFGARDSVAEVHARWAAISGVEQAIAILADDARDPHPSDAFHVYERLAQDAAMDVGDRASFDIETWDREDRLAGPSDAHGRIHVSRMTAEDLFWLPSMTEDLISRIIDWADEDDDTSPLGAELGVYLSQPYPYEPRNGVPQTIEELELISGILPTDVREEDWNLNGVLDPNENDGGDTWPPDDADGELDAGWSGIITVLPSETTLGLSGEPKVRLGLGLGTGDLVARTGMSGEQAEVLGEYAALPTSSLEALVTTDLSSLRGIGNQIINADVPDLTDEQLGLLLEEAAIDGEWLDAAGPRLPGRININTVHEDVLGYAPGVTTSIADALIAERNGRPLGFRTAADLLEIPDLTRGRVQQLLSQFCFRSSTFVVRSVGRDRASGVEVEVIAVVDRSRLPVTIQDLIVR
ncbi:MAG: helix-hairpin-helix domain-containing protein [Planctomycetota bacterium]